MYVYIVDVYRSASKKHIEPLKVQDAIFCSIRMKWEDRRYVNGGSSEKHQEKCEKNMMRRLKCPSMSVVWTETNQFWIPHLNVEDSLALVKPPLTKLNHICGLKFL